MSNADEPASKPEPSTVKDGNYAAHLDPTPKSVTRAWLLFLVQLPVVILYYAAFLAAGALVLGWKLLEWAHLIVIFLMGLALLYIGVTGWQQNSAWETTLLLGIGALLSVGAPAFAFSKNK